MTRDLHEGVARIKRDRTVMWIGNETVCIWVEEVQQYMAGQAGCDMKSTHCGLRHTRMSENKVPYFIATK
jgi:hypothetical protein